MLHSHELCLCWVYVTIREHRYQVCQGGKSQSFDCKYISNFLMINFEGQIRGRGSITDPSPSDISGVLDAGCGYHCKFVLLDVGPVFPSDFHARRRLQVAPYRHARLHVSCTDSWKYSYTTHMVGYYAKSRNYCKP